MMAFLKNSLLFFFNYLVNHHEEHEEHEDYMNTN
jgi:hypothetical protein